MTPSRSRPELWTVSAQRCCWAQVTAEKQFGHAEHAVERRADLVTHGRQKLALSPRGGECGLQRAVASPSSVKHPNAADQGQ